jgi:6-phosphogluconate dehydrogenase
MQIGVVGLGRMGGNISRRLLQHGHDVVVFDRDQNAVAELGKAKAKPAKTLDDLIKQLTAPRTVWVMLPSGKPTESTIAELAGLWARMTPSSMAEILFTKTTSAARRS